MLLALRKTLALFHLIVRGTITISHKISCLGFEITAVYISETLCINDHREYSKLLPSKTHSKALENWIQAYIFLSFLFQVYDFHVMKYALANHVYIIPSNYQKDRIWRC